MRIKTFAFVFLSICVLVNFTGCFGQKGKTKPESFTIERFTNAKGLPCEEITHLAVLGEKIWAGSQKGLFAFDGVNWEIHSEKNNNILGSDEILDLQVLDNKLYISTDSGACCYDGSNFRSLFTSRRACASVGKGSEFAVGTASGIVVNGKTYGKSSGLTSTEITKMLYDKKGRLWISTREGMSCYSAGMLKTYKGLGKELAGSSLIDVPPKPANCRLPNNNIKSMILFKDGLAIATVGGLCITDMDNNYEVYTADHTDWAQINGKIVDAPVAGNSKIPGNKISALTASTNDELLFVITDKGLGILKEKEWLDVDKLIPGLPKTGLTDVAWCKDDLWISSAEEGIFKVKGLSALIDADEKK